MRPLTLSLTLLLGLLGAAAHADEPIPGQPYAIPQGYEGYSPGSVINYGGYNYVIQDNATMLLADSPDGGGTDDGTADDGTAADESVPVNCTAYQVPPGYEDAQVGSQISYGGNDYTVLSGGVMTLCNPGYSVVDGTQYQIPAGYAGAGVGSIVTYGGFNYLIGTGVMVKINVNAGYAATPRPGQAISTLTRPAAGGSRPHPGIPGRPSPANPTGHVTYRPTYPATAGPGRVNPGAGHPGYVHPGYVHPNNVYPGYVHPGYVHPNNVHPGYVHPGYVHPNNVHPGYVHPNNVRPGYVHPGNVQPGRGRPAFAQGGGGRPMIGGGRVGRR